MKNFWILLLLVLPTIVCVFNAPNKFSAFADDDVIEDDLVDVESEDGAVTGEDVEPDDDVESSSSTTSPYADTVLLFTKPLYTPGQQLDLPGGKVVEFLVGFHNKGPQDFVVETVEASFRYPMDFNYIIQNFSSIAYNRQVPPGSEATFSYSFMPSDQYAGRPFGLNIALGYRDAVGLHFSEAVFNETVLISEVDEGLDGETFFLYLLLAAVFVLLLVIGQQYLLGSSGKRKRSTAKKVVETGTTNDSFIEYDWLPQETMRALQLNAKNQNSKTSPKAVKSSSNAKAGQSPKARKVKRSAGDD